MKILHIYDLKTDQRLARIVDKGKGYIVVITEPECPKLLRKGFKRAISLSWLTFRDQRKGKTHHQYMGEI